MSLDAIRQVGEWEQAAQQGITDAQAKARLLIADAQRTADAQIETAQKAAAQKTSEAAAIARERSAVFAAEQQAQASADCIALRENALLRMDRAVSIVVEKVVTG
ncbi:MAG: hypothetical protein RRY21_00560 [Oscillospiraceae bacterium]